MWQPACAKCWPWVCTHQPAMGEHAGGNQHVHSHGRTTAHLATNGVRACGSPHVHMAWHTIAHAKLPWVCMHVAACTCTLLATRVRRPCCLGCACMWQPPCAHCWPHRCTHHAATGVLRCVCMRQPACAHRWPHTAQTMLSWACMHVAACTCTMLATLAHTPCGQWCAIVQAATCMHMHGSMVCAWDVPACESPHVHIVAAHHAARGVRRRACTM
jgi:hypothetical protein